jgi:hypothetical protein
VHDIVTTTGHVVIVMMVMSPHRPIGRTLVQSPSLTLKQHFSFYVIIVSLLDFFYRPIGS